MMNSFKNNNGTVSDETQSLTIDPYITVQEYRQRLIRLYLDYVRRTGKIDYPPLRDLIYKSRIRRTLYEQSLIRLYLDYVRRTGKIDYPPLQEFIDNFFADHPSIY